VALLSPGRKVICAELVITRNTLSSFVPPAERTSTPLERAALLSGSGGSALSLLLGGGISLGLRGGGGGGISIGLRGGGGGGISIGLRGGGISLGLRGGGCALSLLLGGFLDLAPGVGIVQNPVQNPSENLESQDAEGYDESHDELP